MSEKDMDQMPRMKDYLKAEDLDTDACVTLADGPGVARQIIKQALRGTKAEVGT